MAHYRIDDSPWKRRRKISSEATRAADLARPDIHARIDSQCEQSNRFIARARDTLRKAS
jgi:hypothetical protein